MMDVLGVLILVGLLAGFAVSVFLYVRGLARGARAAQTFFTATPKPASPEPPGNPIAESKFGQRIGGLFLAGLGCSCVVRLWAEGFQPGDWHLFAAILFPLFAVVGIGMLLFPTDVEYQRWKFGTARPRAWSEVPIPMKVSVIVGGFAGVANAVAWRILAV